MKYKKTREPDHTYPLIEGKVRVERLMVSLNDDTLKGISVCDIFWLANECSYTPFYKNGDRFPYFRTITKSDLKKLEQIANKDRSEIWFEASEAKALTEAAMLRQEQENNDIYDEILYD
jgi:hypothetical protein